MNNSNQTPEEPHPIHEKWNQIWRKGERPDLNREQHVWEAMKEYSRQSNRELLEALESAHAFIKNEASQAMRNGANRDVVDYYDNKACELNKAIQKHKQA